jgi:hypothetical protein
MKLSYMTMKEIQNEGLHRYSSQNNVSAQFRKDKFPGYLARMGTMKN